MSRTVPRCPWCKLPIRAMDVRRYGRVLGNVVVGVSAFTAATSTSTESTPVSRAASHDPNDESDPFASDTDSSWSQDGAGSPVSPDEQDKAPVKENGKSGEADESEGEGEEDEEEEQEGVANGDDESKDEYEEVKPKKKQGKKQKGKKEASNGDFKASGVPYEPVLVGLRDRTQIEKLISWRMNPDNGKESFSSKYELLSRRMVEPGGVEEGKTGMTRKPDPLVHTHTQQRTPLTFTDMSELDSLPRPSYNEVALRPKVSLAVDEYDDVPVACLESAPFTNLVFKHNFHWDKLIEVVMPAVQHLRGAPSKFSSLRLSGEGNDPCYTIPALSFIELVLTANVRKLDASDITIGQELAVNIVDDHLTHVEILTLANITFLNDHPFKPFLSRHVTELCLYKVTMRKTQKAAKDESGDKIDFENIPAEDLASMLPAVIDFLTELLDRDVSITKISLPDESFRHCSELYKVVFGIPTIDDIEMYLPDAFGTNIINDVVPIHERTGPIRRVKFWTTRDRFAGTTDKEIAKTLDKTFHKQKEAFRRTVESLMVEEWDDPSFVQPIGG
ncbi:hypothetical protein HDV00_000956 [Rhizophlyctis rosea]|nr:hypothetical protein HDV00_000956 [Rhizophlyctis rosea]